MTHVLSMLWSRWYLGDDDVEVVLGPSICNNISGGLVEMMMLADRFLIKF